MASLGSVPYSIRKAAKKIHEHFKQYLTVEDLDTKTLKLVSRIFLPDPKDDSGSFEPKEIKDKKKKRKNRRGGQ